MGTATEYSRKRKQVSTSQVERLERMAQAANKDYQTTQKKKQKEG